MQFELFARGVSALAVDCLVVGIHEENELSDGAHQVDKASAGALTRLVTRGDFPGKLGETMLLGEWPGLAAKRLMLVGQGPKASLTRKSWRRAYSAAVAGVAKTQAASAAFALARPVAKQLDDYHWARAAAELTLAALYRINDLKTSKKPKPAPLAKVLLGPARASARLASALKQGRAIGLGARAMRDLANLPANRCTPSYLAAEAQSLAKRYRHLQVKVLDEPAIRREKMGCFLAVTQGSDEPPRFIVMRYRGGRPDDAPIALVGKGITFDTGGISLKDPPAMDEMKFDMSGAASVFGALVAACEMQLKLNVTGIVAACENMPSGRAIKPGDIVTSAAGLTVEILNTDAEGRLILCDALHYARRFKPAAVIDIATLTGACVVALGAHHSGLMSNDDALARELLAAGQRADDRAWHLPIGEEYVDQLKSNFADLANVAGRDGGALTAASFLSKFTQGLKWAHLDIAGTAYFGGALKGSTGRPVGLLCDFLINRAGR